MAAPANGNSVIRRDPASHSAAWFPVKPNGSGNGRLGSFRAWPAGTGGGKTTSDKRAPRPSPNPHSHHRSGLMYASTDPTNMSAATSGITLSYSTRKPTARSTYPAATEQAKKTGARMSDIGTHALYHKALEMANT